MQKVCVIGVGYVGLPVACQCVKNNFEVICADVNQEKLDLISKGVSPIKDDKIQKELLEIYSKFELSTDISSSAGKADIIVICVPTPIKEKKEPDLSHLKSSLEAVSKTLKKNQLIIIESTIYPGLTEEFAKPILEQNGLKAGVDFFLAHCPERINPGDNKWFLENIPRVVSAVSPKGTKIAAEFYRKIITAEVMELNSLKEAEATKILENTFRDINIAFVNELAKSFDAMGINIYEVIKGASTKPFAFTPHYPGPGVGGHCIPIDPYYLIEKAKQKGFEHSFLILARQINESMPAYVVEKTQSALNEINITAENAKITMLVLAYKKNINDIQENP